MKHAFLYILIFISFNVYCDDLFITDFGAIGDNKTINTLSIQKTIDAVYASGGGKVIIPNGRFVSGTIFLKDNYLLKLIAIKTSKTLRWISSALLTMI